MPYFYAASYLSLPVLYKNGALAGVCKEIAFSSRLTKMTGLIVYDREGRRRFLAARYIASSGYDAVLLKTGAVLSDPMGSFPLGRLALLSDGKPLSRVEDAALDEKRNVAFFTLHSGETFSPDAVLKNSSAAVVFQSEDAPPSPKRRTVKKKPDASRASAPNRRRSAPKADPLPVTDGERETEQLSLTDAENALAASDEAALSVPDASLSENDVAADCAFASPENPATSAPPAKTGGKSDETARGNAPFSRSEPTSDSLSQSASPNPSSSATAARDAESATGTLPPVRPAATLLYTLPGTGVLLPERVADGRSLVGRIMQADLYTRNGLSIARAGDRVTPETVSAAARAGLTVELVRKSRPVLF